MTDYTERVVRGKGSDEYITINGVKKYLKYNAFDVRTRGDGKKVVRIPKAGRKKSAKTKKLEKEIKYLRRYLEDPYYDRYGYYRGRRGRKKSRDRDYSGRRGRHKRSGLTDFMKKLDAEHKKREKAPAKARAKEQKQIKSLTKEMRALEAQDKQSFAQLEQLIQYYIQEWNEMAPKTLEEALEVGRVCGQACFLEPNTGDYPVCPRCGDNGCFCMPLCSGLYNAKQLATFRNDVYTENLATSLAMEMGCDWALLIRAYLEYKYPRALKLF